METKNDSVKKIPFFFTPIPNFLFSDIFFHDIDYFRFICFAFYRTTFEKKVVFHNGRRVELDCLEFIYGRDSWSLSLQMMPRKLRSFIGQLLCTPLLEKVTSKTTSTFTVYKWSCSHFYGGFGQQTGSKVTSTPPAKRPAIIKDKNKRIEKEAAAIDEVTVLFGDFAAAPIFTSDNLLSALPDDERNRVIDLLNKRAKSKEISNPEGWIRDCIKNGWHKEVREPIENQPKKEFEANKQIARKLVEQLNGHPGIQIWLRIDFLEIGRVGSSLWQIFFCEGSIMFLKQIEVALRKLDLSFDIEYLVGP